MSKPWSQYYSQIDQMPALNGQKTLDRYLSHSAAEFPERVAIVFGIRLGPIVLDRRMTYRELDYQVDRFAKSLQELGIKKGERVVVMLPNCPQFVIACYAIWRIGAVIVCCNPLYQEPEVNHIMKDSGSDTIIVLTGLYSKIQALHREIPIKRVIVTNIKEYFPWSLSLLFTWTKEKKEGHRLDQKTKKDLLDFQSLLKDASGSPQSIEMTPQDTSTLIYTSATTGKAKGVEHTHLNQAISSEILNNWIKTRRGRETMLGVMPFFHIYGLSVVMNSAISAASTLVLIPNPRDINHIVLSVEKHRITHFLAVPAIYTMFNDSPEVKKHSVTSIRFASSGSSLLYPEVKQRFEEITGGVLADAYGSTESLVVALNPVNRTKAGSVGIPLPGCDIKIVDIETGLRELPTGEVGEIIVKAPFLMKGYWNNPAGTSESIRTDFEKGQSWFYTGDIGRMDQEGYLSIVDRKNDLIISSGYNIYPAEVEAVIQLHPKVEEPAVFGITHPQKGEIALAAVVLKKDQKLTEEELLVFCRKHLAAYKVPRSIQFVEALPKSVIGKVLRRNLREQYSGSFQMP